ncbi:tetratricopeptide repeat protein [Denitromonas halophila]|uniref:Tetratricopeptide repeat protein n=1 Tax=Denitromonas halophila TaxID=1629404 RepID=A0A557QER2_9RHOO|nr:tetratricopeptide repeat protein [Denitromonas halophila]
MPHSPSAAPAERPRVVSLRALVIFGALATAGMVLLFPYETLVKASLGARQGDVLAAAYLHNLLRTETDNAQMRFALAAQHDARRDYPAARQAIAPLLGHPDPAIDRRARWLDWRFTVDDAPDARTPLALNLQQRHILRTLAGDPALSTADRLSLITYAAQHTQTEIATHAIDALHANADIDADAAQTLADTLRRDAHPHLAARAYLLARDRSEGLAAQRQYFLAALRTLQAISDFPAALAIANQALGALADDAPTLTFLIGLARAANRPDRAADYARRLIRLSLREQLDGSFRLVALSSNADPALPFDDARYRLAYDTFLGAGALEDAYVLSLSAVRQAPDSADWRRRLAQAAEWHGKPADALAQWYHLARNDHTDAWAQVLRLAPGLFEHRMLLDAHQFQLRQRPRDTAQLRDIAALYERLGEPDAGIAYLQAHTTRHPSDAGFDALATLAERAGQGAIADAALVMWAQHAGASTALSLRRAVGLIPRGQLEAALAALDATRTQAPDDATDYWQLRASLAGLLQDRDAQRDALSRLVPQPTARPDDFADLIELLRRTHPDQAARLAAQAWERLGTPDWLLRSLDLHLSTRNYAAMGTLIRALDDAPRTALERNASFLRLRGQWHQGLGEFDAARDDFEAALAHDPANTAARASLLWLLIDGGKADTLTALLARHETRWARDTDLHDALAAANALLSRPQRALDRYLLPRAGANRDDFLWMMGLADTLEQAGEIDRAWHLREQQWQQRPRTAPTDQSADLARRAAEVRLARQQRPGDASDQLLRALMRQDGDADPLDTPLLRDVAMSWLLDQGDIDGARGFLWERYARALTRPLWAEAAVALASDERATLAEILARRDTALPAAQRGEIADRLGRPEVAASVTHAAANDQRHNDALHLQLSEVLLDQAHRLRLDAAAHKLDAFKERAQHAELRLRLAPRLKLSLTLGSIQRRLNGSGALAAAPNERQASVEVAWTTDAGLTRLGVARRRGLTDTTPVWLGHDLTLDQRWAFALEAGTQLPANESAALRVAGMKDELLASAAYGLSSRERIAAQWAHSRYSSQHGLALGRADRWQLDYTHRLTRGRPEIEAGVYVGGYRFRADIGNDTGDRAALASILPGGLAPLLPDSYQFRGARMTVNNRQRHGLQRALVPYATLDLNHVSGRGYGYGVEFGLSGRVFGADQLLLGVQHDKGGEGETGRSSTLFLDYQLFF